MLDLLEPHVRQAMRDFDGASSQLSMTPARLFPTSERVDTIHATEKLRDRVTATLHEPVVSVHRARQLVRHCAVVEATGGAVREGNDLLDAPSARRRRRSRNSKGRG